MACAGCLNGDANWKKTHTRQKGVCGAFIPATKATNVGVDAAAAAEQPREGGGLGAVDDRPQEEQGSRL